MFPLASEVIVLFLLASSNGDNDPGILQSANHLINVLLGIKHKDLLYLIPVKNNFRYNPAERAVALDITHGSHANIVENPNYLMSDVKQGSNTMQRRERGAFEINRIIWDLMNHQRNLQMSQQWRNQILLNHQHKNQLDVNHQQHYKPMFKNQQTRQMFKNQQINQRRLNAVNNRLNHVNNQLNAITHNHQQNNQLDANQQHFKPMFKNQQTRQMFKNQQINQRRLNAVNNRLHHVNYQLNAITHNHGKRAVPLDITMGSHANIVHKPDSLRSKIKQASLMMKPRAGVASERSFDIRGLRNHQQKLQITQQLRNQILLNHKYNNQIILNQQQNKQMLFNQQHNQLRLNALNNRLNQVNNQLNAINNNKLTPATIQLNAVSHLLNPFHNRLNTANNQMLNHITNLNHNNKLLKPVNNNLYTVNNRHSPFNTQMNTANNQMLNHITNLNHNNKLLRPVNNNLYTVNNRITPFNTQLNTANNQMLNHITNLNHNNKLLKPVNNNLYTVNNRLTPFNTQLNTVNNRLMLNPSKSLNMNNQNTIGGQQPIRRHGLQFIYGQGIPMMVG